ncbi:unnamed protein product [Gadus morhua 'NCC']
MRKRPGMTTEAVRVVLVPGSYRHRHLPGPGSVNCREETERRTEGFGASLRHLRLGGSALPEQIWREESQTRVALERGGRNCRLRL